MSKKSAKVEVVHTTDRVARLVYNSLRQDFLTVNPYTEHQSPVFGASVQEFRQYEWPDLFASVSKPSEDGKRLIVKRMKALYQLKDLFKKYRFQDDMTTPKQLRNLTYQKYFEFQASRSAYHSGTKRFLDTGCTHRAYLVFQEARRIIKNILGDFSWDEVFDSCRFGRNSSIGCNFADAYLDHKLTCAEAFTGTVRSMARFSAYLVEDRLLARIVKGQVPAMRNVLPLIQVPKSYKINRTITPLALLGLWLSYGIGKVVEERLARHGLNIKTLQQRHAKWIRKYSESLSHATLDMSFGSENIISPHLNRTFPREWFNAIKETFSHQLRYDQCKAYTESVLPMGNGATFPVETLYFYGLIRAIGNLAAIPGRYSAYGDDLILPTKAAPYVFAVFDDIGLKLNKDKSFTSSNFRESCGADYYYGISVRPFYMPEGMKYHQHTSSRYIMWLHKCINGLTRRWDPSEIRLTLRALLIELSAACRGKIYCIPPSFPDTAGVKISDPTRGLTLDPFNWQLPAISYRLGTRNYLFSYWIETPKLRGVKNLACYYWDTLRQRGVNVSEQVEDWLDFKYDDHLHYFDEATPAVSYVREVKRKRYKRKDGSFVVKDEVRMVPYVADRNERSIIRRSRSEFVPTLRKRLKAFKGNHSRGEDPIISDWI